MTEQSISPEPPSSPPRRLTRGNDGRILAGVCSGLGHYTDIDPVIFRVGFGLLVFAGGWGVLLYIAAALLMPGTPYQTARAEQILRRRFDGDSVLAILGLLLAFGVLINFPGLNLQKTVTGLVVLALVLLAAQSRGVNLVEVVRSLPERLKGVPADAFPPPQAAAPVPPAWSGDMPPGAIDLATLGRRPEDLPPQYDPSRPYDPLRQYDPSRPYDTGHEDLPAEPPKSSPQVRSRRRGLGVVGVLSTAATVAVTALALHDSMGWIRATQISLAAWLTLVGLGLLVSTWYGRSRGLAAVGALLSLSLVVAAVPATSDLQGGRFGEVVWRPAQAGAGEQAFKMIVGDGRLDLTGLPLRPGQQVRIRAQLGAGQMRITVPANAELRLQATTTIGDIIVGHQTISGPKARASEVLPPETPGNGAPPVIELHVRGWLGDVEVRRV